MREEGGEEEEGGVDIKGGGVPETQEREEATKLEQDKSGLSFPGQTYKTFASVSFPHTNRASERPWIRDLSPVVCIYLKLFDCVQYKYNKFEAKYERKMKG